jgi:hypothetical protein
MALTFISPHNIMIKYTDEKKLPAVFSLSTSKNDKNVIMVLIKKNKNHKIQLVDWSKTMRYIPKLIDNTVDDYCCYDCDGKRDIKRNPERHRWSYKKSPQTGFSGICHPDAVVEKRGLGIMNDKIVFYNGKYDLGDKKENRRGPNAQVYFVPDLQISHFGEWENYFEIDFYLRRNLIGSLVDIVLEYGYSITVGGLTDWGSD